MASCSSAIWNKLQNLQFFNVHTQCHAMSCFFYHHLQLFDFSSIASPLLEVGWCDLYGLCQFSHGPLMDQLFPSHLFLQSIKFRNVYTSSFSLSCNNSNLLQYYTFLIAVLWLCTLSRVDGVLYEAAPGPGLKWAWPPLQVYVHVAVVVALTLGRLDSAGSLSDGDKHPKDIKFAIGCPLLWA